MRTGRVIAVLVMMAVAIGLVGCSKQSSGQVRTGSGGIVQVPLEEQEGLQARCGRLPGSHQDRAADGSDSIRDCGESASGGKPLKLFHCFDGTGRNRKRVADLTVEFRPTMDGISYALVKVSDYTFSLTGVDVHTRESFRPRRNFVMRLGDIAPERSRQGLVSFEITYKNGKRICVTDALRLSDLRPN
jgi:hypothetical protein